MYPWAKISVQGTVDLCRHLVRPTLLEMRSRRCEVALCVRSVTFIHIWSIADSSPEGLIIMSKNKLRTVTGGEKIKVHCLQKVNLFAITHV